MTTTTPQTLTAYAAAVTEIVSAQTSPDFEFSDQFDVIVAAAFRARLTPAQAAKKYFSSDRPIRRRRRELGRMP